MRMSLKESSQDVTRAVELINFVEDHQSRLSFRANFFQNSIDRLNLFFGLWMAGINDVDEEIGLNNFFQGCFESFHETVWEFADKPDRIGEQHILVGWQPKSSRGWIKSGKQFIFGEDTRAGERIEQGGLSGVGIANDGGQSPMIALPGITLSETLPADDFQVSRNPGDPVLDATTIGFQLRFAFTTAHANTALLAG